MERTTGSTGVAKWAFKIVKDETTKPVPPNTDYRQAFIDLNTGKCDAKESNKRLTNGYYVKKDK